MIEIVLGTAELIMLAATAVGSGFVVYALHRFAVESEKDRADTLARWLSCAKARLVEEHRRAVQAEKKAEKVNGLSNKLSFAEAEIDTLTLQNDNLEREVNTYADTLAEQLDDFGMIHDPDDWLPSLAEFTDERLARRLLERITLAQVFDAVEYARGPVAPYAKAFGIGPFANDHAPLSQLPPTVAAEIYPPLHDLPRHVSTVENSFHSKEDDPILMMLKDLDKILDEAMRADRVIEIQDEQDAARAAKRAARRPK